MQTFIFGLLLACVSGVTVVAFKHPHGYSRLFPYLLTVSTILFIGLTVWHFAIEVTWTNLLKYMLKETLSEAENVKQQLRPSYAWVVFWYVGVVVFLWINLKLPPFLQVADEHDTEMGEGKSR